MGIYIPNMDAKAFDELCKEKGLQFIYTAVPPHGRLIESKVFLQVAHETDDFSLDELAHLAVLAAATPTVIPAEENK